MWPNTKIFKMATGPKAALYQNAQSASYLPPTLTEEMGEIEFLKFILLIAQDLKTMYIMCHVFSRKFKFIRLLDITHFLDLKSYLEAILTFITH